jgi:hypothetical protein
MGARRSNTGAASIPARQVEATQREVAAFDEGRIRGQGRRFIDEQPHLSRFLTVLTREIPGRASEFTFYLGCIVWTMFDRAYGKRLPRVSQDLLVEAFERLRGDMQRFVGSDSRFLESYLRNAEFMRQPHVVRFMVDTLLADSPDGVGMSREARGICLVVLLSGIQAMDAALLPPEAA